MALQRATLLLLRHYGATIATARARSNGVGTRNDCVATSSRRRCAMLLQLATELCSVVAARCGTMQQRVGVRYDVVQRC